MADELIEYRRSDAAVHHRVCLVMLSLVSTAAHVRPLDWWVIAVCAGIAVFAGISGVRLWQGKAISRGSDRSLEDKLAVFTVTFLPTAVMFGSWALIGLASQLQASVHLSGISGLLWVVEMSLALVSVISLGFVISLFFTSRPQRFVPPHLREP